VVQCRRDVDASCMLGVEETQGRSIDDLGLTLLTEQEERFLSSLLLNSNIDMCLGERERVCMSENDTKGGNHSSKALKGRDACSRVRLRCGAELVWKQGTGRHDGGANSLKPFGLPARELHSRNRFIACAPVSAYVSYGPSFAYQRPRSDFYHSCWSYAAAQSEFSTLHDMISALLSPSCPCSASTSSELDFTWDPA